MARVSDITSAIGRAVAGLRRIAGGHGAVRMEDGLQFGQRFEGGVGARTFVLLNDGGAGLGLGPVHGGGVDVHRHHFVVELPSAWAFSAF